MAWRVRAARRGRVHSARSWRHHRRRFSRPRIEGWYQLVGWAVWRTAVCGGCRDGRCRQICARRLRKIETSSRHPASRRGRAQFRVRFGRREPKRGSFARFCQNSVCVFFHATRACSQPMNCSANRVYQCAISSGGRGRASSVHARCLLSDGRTPRSHPLTLPLTRPATCFRAWPRSRQRCGGVAAGGSRRHAGGGARAAAGL